jgi:drug/metabolite transporter (DMT)-like permease
MSSAISLARLAPPAFVFIWATGFVVARLVAPHAEPFTFLATRFAMAAAVLSLIALLVRAPWPASRRAWRDGLIAGVLMHGIYLGAVFWAVDRGLPAGIAALVTGLQPLVTAMLVGPLLGERVSGRRWLGIGIGFAGALLVIAPRLTGADPAVGPLAVCFAGMVAITLGTIWQKRTAASADLRSNAAVQFMGAGAMMLPLALTTEDLTLEPVPALWVGLLWSVFGLSIGAISLLLLLIRRGAVAGVASLLYLVPPVSALLAYLLFGETLTPLQVGGMAVAAAGVALASRG